MSIRDFDERFYDEQRRLMETIEDRLRDSDHRSTGGFKTQDTEFAWYVSEDLREILRFMYRTEEILDEMVASHRSTVNELEYGIEERDKIIEDVGRAIRHHDNML